MIETFTHPGKRMFNENYLRVVYNGKDLVQKITIEQKLSKSF